MSMWRVRSLLLRSNDRSPPPFPATLGAGPCTCCTARAAPSSSCHTTRRASRPRPGRCWAADDPRCSSRRRQRQTHSGASSDRLLAAVAVREAGRPPVWRGGGSVWRGRGVPRRLSGVARARVRARSPTPPSPKSQS
eukprot:4422685-Prymnesium_polylepis.1